MFIVRVTLIVQLCIGYGSARRANVTIWRTHKLQYSDLHHALIEIRRFVLHDFHRHHLVGLHILTFDDLAERSLAENVQDEVPAPR